MVLQVKAEQIITEHAIQQFVFPGKGAESFAIRPRNVPELGDRQVRIPRFEHPRQQREMIILDENQSGTAIRLFQNGFRKQLVRIPIARPVFGAETRTMERRVTQRPESLVRKAVIVAFLRLFRQPDSAKRIGRRLRRDTHMIPRIDHLPVRIAAAMRDPHAARSPQNWVQRCRQTAGRLSADDPATFANVDVGFAVRNGDQFYAAQLVGHEGLKTLPGPVFHMLYSGRSPVIQV